MNSFDRIIGYEAEKKELYQIIDMFKNREKYDKIGAKLPKGLLIYGHPGLGKTMLAEALIKECNVDTFTFKKNDDDKKCMAEIDHAFDEAKALKRAIIFFDDLDKFSDKNRNESIDCKVYNNLQKNIDSARDKNVFILATANDYDKLPKSLVRSGRFDMKMFINPPKSEDAKKIIEYYLGQKQVSNDLNYDDISKMIDYRSCSDLEKIANEAAIISAYRNKEVIDIDDIASAYLKDNFLSLPELCDWLDNESCIYHEAGHAAVAEVIKAQSLNFITVQGKLKKNVLGFVQVGKNLRRPELILTTLGGKAACELFSDGGVASGCSDDIERASSLLRDGIGSNGICGFGAINVENDDQERSQQELFTQESYVRAELERYYFLAKKILLKNKDFYFKLVDALKKKDYLLFSEIQKIRKSSSIEPFYAC